MHHTPTLSLRLLTIATLATTLIGSALHATLPVLSSGENLIFSDDFTNNANAWSNVSVVNGTGTATTGTPAINGGAWAPSILGDLGAVQSDYTFATALNVFDGPISLYMRVRVDNPNGTADGTKFQITFNESTGNRFFNLVVRDGAAGFIEYRDAGGQGASTATSTYNYTDNTTFVDFKVTLTPGADVSQLATAEAFRFNTATSTYDSIGLVSNAVDLDTGLFNRLNINNRNGTDGGVFFDSVAVTQIPEPSTFAAIIGVFVLLGTLVRRKRTRIVA